VCLGAKELVRSLQTREGIEGGAGRRVGTPAALALTLAGPGLSSAFACSRRVLGTETNRIPGTVPGLVAQKKTKMWGLIPLLLIRRGPPGVIQPPPLLLYNESSPFIALCAELLTWCKAILGGGGLCHVMPPLSPLLPSWSLLSPRVKTIGECVGDYFLWCEAGLGTQDGIASLSLRIIID